jgi:hypothetical protein
MPCALFISSFRHSNLSPSSAFSSGKFDLTWSKWILLSDGSNLVFFGLRGGKETGKKIIDPFRRESSNEPQIIQEI